MTAARVRSEQVSAMPVEAWSVLDAVGEAVSVHDAEGRLVYANARSRQLLGDLRERMDGRPVGSVPWAALRPGGTRIESAELPVEVARTTGATVRDEVIGFPGARGDVRWLRITARPLQGSAPPCAVVATFTDVTAPQAAQEHLDRTEHEHRALVDGLFEGVVAQDASGSVVASNPSAAATLGLTQDELEGRASIDPRWRAIHEDGTPFPGERHPAMEVLRTGEPQLMKTMGVHTPAGELRWLQVNSRPRRDDAGRVVGAVTSFLDVTARREAERATAAAGRRLEATVEHLAEAVVLWDREGRPVLRNAATERLRARLGVEIDPDGHHGAVDVVGPGGAPLPEARWPWVRARRSGEVVLGEEIGLRDAAGEVRWMEVTATPINAATGPAPYEVTMSLFDVTERRAEIRRLDTLQRQLRTIIDRSPIGMGIVTLEGTILDVNDAFAAIVGWPRTSLLGRPRAQFTHPDEQPQERELLARVVAGETDGYRLEKRYVRPDGDHVWVQADVAAIRDADGRVEMLVGQVQDISDRRDREARLEHLADHDPLTGLLNRRAFDRALWRQAAHHRRYDTGGGVLLIDLDRFKAVNDILGHDAGDALLVRVARTLRENLRTTDLVARLGGDEFAVLVPEGDARAVRCVAASVSSLLNEGSATAVPAPCRVTASVGHALFGETEDPADLLRRADRSMYESKRHRGPVIDSAG